MTHREPYDRMSNLTDLRGTLSLSGNIRVEGKDYRCEPDRDLIDMNLGLDRKLQMQAARSVPRLRNLQS